jgi:hypothetical protein
MKRGLTRSQVCLSVCPRLVDLDGILYGGDAIAGDLDAIT